MRPHLATSLPFRGPRHYIVHVTYVPQPRWRFEADGPGSATHRRGPRGRAESRRTVSAICAGWPMRQTLAQIILPREHDKRKAISCIEFGGRVRLRPRWQRGRVHRRPLESSSLMMLTRRARRSGVDQAVVRVADRRSRRVCEGSTGRTAPSKPRPVNVV